MTGPPAESVYKVLLGVTDDCPDPECDARLTLVETYDGALASATCHRCGFYIETDVVRFPARGAGP